MPNGKVAREAPVSDERFRRCGLVLEVAFHDGIATYHDLADGCAIARYRAHCLGISDRDRFDHGVGDALACHLGKAFVGRQCVPFRQEDAGGRGSVGFRSAVKMRDPKAERLHGPEDGRRGRRAAGRNSDGVIERHALVGGRMSQHIEYDRRTAEMRDPMMGNQPEDCCRLYLAKAYLCTTGGDDGPRIGPTRTMEHRQRPKIDAVETKSEAEAVTKRRKVGASVAVDDAFRIAGGARSVKQAKRLPFVRDSWPSERRISGSNE